MTATRERQTAGTGKAPPKARRGEGKVVRLRLSKSGICTPRDQKATLRGLGFKRVGQVVLREDNPAIRGMIQKVRHLVDVLGPGNGRG